MKFKIEKACEVLERTPGMLAAMLGGLADDWTRSSGAAGDWEAFDVVGHLIHGERTDWIPRAEIIIAQGADRTFVPFDRFAQFEDSAGKRLSDLLGEFSAIRGENLRKLRSWNLTDESLELRGMHPELGEVTLGQLLATWVVHDLNHVSQISKSMARKYAGNVGAWKEYLSILN